MVHDMTLTTQGKGEVVEEEESNEDMNKDGVAS